MTWSCANWRGVEAEAARQGQRDIDPETTSSVPGFRGSLPRSDHWSGKLTSARFAPRGLRGTGVAFSLLIALLFAGCGSSGPSASSNSSTTPTSTNGTTPPTTSANTASTTCPTAAEISAAAAATYPAPTSSSSSGTVTCNYSDPTTGANLVILTSPAPGASRSEERRVGKEGRSRGSPY